MMYSDKICVDTPFGKLCATIGGDCNYPEIFVYIERPDGVEIDLTAVGMDLLNKPDIISIYNYLDTHVDDWTNKYELTAEEINIDAV